MSIIFEHVCDNCRNKDICKYSEKMRRVETAVIDTLRQQDNPKGSTDFIVSNGLRCKYYSGVPRVRCEQTDTSTTQILVNSPLEMNCERFVY